MDISNHNNATTKPVREKPDYRIAFLCVITMILLFIANIVNAQSGTSIQLSSTPSAVNAVNEQLVDIMGKLYNRSGAAISGDITINVSAGLQLISRNKIPVSLQPGDSLFIPVKVFVTRKAISARTQQLSIELYQQNTVLAAVTTQITVVANRNISLFSTVSDILLDNSTDSVIIPVRVANNGNTAQKITLVSAFPASVQEGAFHPTQQLTLEASTDTLIYFSRPVNNRMIASEGFNVTITGFYQNSDMIGMVYIRVQSARSNRNYRTQNGYENYNNNTISLSSLAMFTPMQSYMLRGGGITDLGAAKLGYNLDLTTWKGGYAPAMLRNTWVNLHTNKLGVHLGNINRMLDINLSGRGAAVFVFDTAAHNQYEAGYMDGNTNLLGNTYSKLFPTSQAGWGSFTHAQKNWQLNSFAVYESNPMMNTRNAIVSNVFNLHTAKNMHYTFTAGIGRTALFDSSSMHQWGAAAGAGINGTIGKISINSNNYFSTGYYPGLQRGALSLSERITWLKTNTSTIWANVDYYRYSPKALSAFQLFLPAFGMLRAEAGLSGKISKLNLSAAPRFSQESSNAYQLNGPGGDIQRLTAWDITSTLNYPIADNQYFSLNTELGFYSSSFDPAQRFHLRANSYLRKGMLSLNTSFQLGTFYLGEAANNYVSKTPATWLVSIIPSIQKSFFRNKLLAEASIAYMNGGYAGSSWYITGRGTYAATTKTSVYASVNYSMYGNYHANIIEMGITQQLPIPKPGKKSSTLELQLFKDTNGNNQYDKGDSTANGFLVYINDEVFITDGVGNISYKNLPDGRYRLSIPVNHGWYAPEQYIQLDKKSRVQIALQQTGIIRGSLRYLADEFSRELSRDLSGIVVFATDGNHTYSTRSGADGKYIFYIPLGEYTIDLDAQTLPSEVEAVSPQQKLKLATGSAQTIDFTLRVKKKKLEVKKFIAPTTGNEKPK
jgi:hypothetical protein